MSSLTYPEKMESVAEKVGKNKYSLSLSGLLATVVLIVVLLVAVALIFFFVGRKHAPLPDSSQIGQEGDRSGEIIETTTEPSPESPEPTPEELRIPRSTKPIHYNLKMKTYLPLERKDEKDDEDFPFEAELSIHIMCLQTTSIITLNLNELIIDENSIRVSRSNGDGIIKFDKIVYEEKLEMVEIHFKQDLEVDGEYILSMNYTGPISNKLSGFYKSSYVQNGKTKYIAATQFEPTDARRALPCYDEPDLKATFKVSIMHPVGTVALSNGDVLSSPQSSDGWILTNFGQTPIMSTYLLAFVVGDLKKNEGKTKSGVTFRIWSRPEMVQQTEYASKVGPEVLDLFEEYYKVPYPMKKQDMVALPDFNAGAMENWGLITYRENYLLYDPKLYDLRSKQAVAQVIAHELAHQWFGNLVTMKWWDDIWLNEGFASYMEYIGTETESAGNFDLNDQFFNLDMSRALTKDQTANSHPLSTLILKANDVSEIFDTISYQKGASMLRMLNHEIGDAAFKRAVTVYLEKFAYSNTHYTDLWSVMSQSVPEDKLDWNGKRLNVTEWMGPWTRQMGFPQINVQINAENDLVISQKRFKMNPEAKELPIYQESPFNYQWYIPVTYKVISSDQAPGSQVNHTAWLEPNQQKTLQRNVGADDVFSLNPGVFGYYRVNYDLECWNRIIKQLETNHKAFDAPVRSSMISDAFTFAESGILDYDLPLKLTKYLYMEEEYPPWQSAFSGLSSIAGYFIGSHKFYLFKAYMQSILTPAYKKFPLAESKPEEGVLKEQLRKAIASKSCYYDVLDCQETMATKFNELMSNCEGDEQLSSCHDIPPHARSIVYCNGIKAGKEKEFDFLWSKYLLEQNSVEHKRIMSALTCSIDPPTLMLMLNKTIDGGEIREQNVYIFLNGVSRNVIGQYLMWDFMQENLDRFVQKFESSPGTIATLIRTGSVNMGTRHGQKMFSNFVNDNSEIAKKYGVFRQVQERISSKIKWKDTHFDYLINWFDQNKSV